MFITSDLPSCGPKSAPLRDRQPTIKELAGFLQLDKTSVTGLVDRARSAGSSAGPLPC